MGRRLLVITNSFPDREGKHIGGIFVKDQLKTVAPHFDEVHVVYPSTLGLRHRPREDFEDYQFDNVHVHFMGYFNIPLFLRFAKKVFAFFLARALVKLIRRQGIQFDVVHAHFTWPSGRAAVELKKTFGKPLVITEHTSLTLRSAAERMDPQFIRAWNGCDILIRNTSSDLGLFRDLGVPDEKLRHVPNGYDESLFTPMDMEGCRRELGLPLDKRIMITVGGLEEVKGHRYLFAALKDIARKRDDVVSVVVGRGPIESNLKALVRSEGLEERVMFVGQRPRSDLPKWMCASDIVVHPSLSESGPLVMLEAMGCGRPFIGTSVGSVPEVVTSEEFGLVCSPGDAEALAKNIDTALSVKWDSWKISKHVRRYSNKETGKQLVAIYDEVVARSGG